MSRRKVEGKPKNPRKCVCGLTLPRVVLLAQEKNGVAEPYICECGRKFMPTERFESWRAAR